MTFCKLLSVLVLIHNTEVSVSIIGGTDAPEGSWPWMVNVNMTSVTGHNWRCGGTLLNSYWVLTAAHCMDRQLQPSVRRSMVWVGLLALQRQAARYLAIDTVVRHPYYQALGNGYVNDIALIKLKKPVTFSQVVAPVDLSSAHDVLGSSTECWTMGWGDIGIGVPLPDPEILQQVKIPLLPQTNCEGERYQTISRVVLAGDKAGGKGPCGGDCGGPLMCRVARGFVQVGIISYAGHAGCGLPGSPGVYTRVSKHLCFINNYINSGSFNKVLCKHSGNISPAFYIDSDYDTDWITF